MNRKIILVYRDRPRLQFLALLEAGILSYWASNPREALEQFQRLPYLDAIVVDVDENVERGLEFCDIVHVNKPALPILFIRSSNRISLVPQCAHRILDPETSEEDLARAILEVLSDAAEDGRKPA